MDEKKSIVGSQIRGLRIQRGISRQALADHTALSFSTIKSYENGLREPNSKAMAALESFFGVSGAYLRGEAEDAAPWNAPASTAKNTDGPYEMPIGQFNALRHEAQLLARREAYAALPESRNRIKRQLHNCHCAMIVEAVAAAALGVGLILALAIPASAQPVVSKSTLPLVSASMTLPAFEEPELSPAYTTAPVYDVPLPADHYAAVAVACGDYNVPLDLALAVMGAESCYQPDADNGVCVGYFQINRNYAEAYLVELGVQTVTDPLDNIRCGVWYLGQLLDQYDGETDHALMGYNLGSQADRLWREGTHSTAYTEKVHREMDRLHGKA